MSKRYEIATFGGGCFWYMVKPFVYHHGIKCVTVGYTGGCTKNPRHEEVRSGITGHVEAVQVIFDPEELSYEILLELFWQHIDPTDPNGQFTDRGPAFKPAIFCHSERQRQLAQNSKIRLNNSGIFNKPIVAEILDAGQFYPAEEIHQDFYKRQPEQYQRYYNDSGRQSFLEKYWSLIYIS